MILKDAWTIAEKDLRTELRSKEILLTMGFFGFLAVLIMSFAFFRGDAPIAAVASGILWVAIAFSGTLGLGRAFDREREGDTIKALLLTPVPRASIYLGKVLGIAVFMLVVELIVVPAVIFFFSLPIDPDRLLGIALVALLGTIGYAVVGTLLAASLLRAHAKDVLLAVIVYPVVIPILIAGVKGTSALLEPAIAYDEFAVWTRILAVFDLVFFIASMWLFEPVILD